MNPPTPRARRISYQVATSLDGYIAGPTGEYDWIVPEPTFDFKAHFAQFDTFLMGRRTWEATQAMGGPGFGKAKVIVFSRTLEPDDHPGVEIVANGIDERLRALRAEPGKDIWLFGGGDLLRSLLALGQVDTVELAVIPTLLGEEWHAAATMRKGSRRHAGSGAVAFRAADRANEATAADAERVKGGWAAV